MLAEVLDYLKNHFVDTIELIGAIETDGITGAFAETYVVGQWVSIDGTKVNDGIYKVLEATTSKITLDATLTVESPSYAFVFGLAIPKTVIDIVSKITTYNSKSQAGLASESQGNRSVSYASDSSWTNVYRNVLAPYKKVYDDKAILRDYTLQRGRW